MSERTAIVVGAHAVIGSNLIDHLLTLGGWQVIGLSRRGGSDVPGLRHVAVDLTDPNATRAIARELAAVTHVFYVAYQGRPTWPSSSPRTWRCLPSSTRSQTTPGWST